MGLAYATCSSALQEEHTNKKDIWINFAESKLWRAFGCLPRTLLKQTSCVTYGDATLTKRAKVASQNELKNDTGNWGTALPDERESRPDDSPCKRNRGDSVDSGFTGKVRISSAVGRRDLGVFPIGGDWAGKIGCSKRSLGDSLEIASNSFRASIVMEVKSWSSASTGFFWRRERHFPRIESKFTNLPWKMAPLSLQCDQRCQMWSPSHKQTSIEWFYLEYRILEINSPNSGDEIAAKLILLEIQQLWNNQSQTSRILLLLSFWVGKCVDQKAIVPESLYFWFSIVTRFSSTCKLRWGTLG